MMVTSALSGVVAPEALVEPDESAWSALGRPPEAVVSPTDESEASAVLAWATREGVGIVPAASGRRLRPTPMAGPYLVLTSERLSGLEIYEPADLTFTARAGTPMRDLGRALAENRQWLPFDPPELAQRSLGGLVADGDSGPLWMGYGALRNHVLGLTVVTGDGRVLRLGGRVVKNVAGFDVIKLMVGGRGRLGLITSVCMRAFPVPTAERVLVLAGTRLSELVPAALAVGTAPVLAVSCVLSADAGGARLTVRLHGADATVEADRRTLEAHLGVGFGVETGDGERAADPDGPSEGAAGALGSERTGGPRSADTTVTATLRPSRLPGLIAAIEALGARSLTFDTYAARLRAVLPGAPANAVADLRGRVEALGGALAIERAPTDADLTDLGVLTGLASRPSGPELELAENLTRVFDPAGVLWRSGL